MRLLLKTAHGPGMRRDDDHWERLQRGGCCPSPFRRMDVDQMDQMSVRSSGYIPPRWQKRAHVSFPCAVTIMRTGKSTASAIRPRRTSGPMLLSLITLSGVYPPATSVHPGVPRSVIAGARWPSRGRSVSRPRVYRQILQKASRGRGGINAHSSGPASSCSGA